MGDREWSYSIRGRAQLAIEGLLPSAPSTLRAAPVYDATPMGCMLAHADVIARHEIPVTGWCVSRAITDFSWMPYLADLAVAMPFQRRGIGELIRQNTCYRSAYHLFAARRSRTSYPHIGMLRHIPVAIDPLSSAIVQCPLCESVKLLVRRLSPPPLCLHMHSGCRLDLSAVCYPGAGESKLVGTSSRSICAEHERRFGLARPGFEAGITVLNTPVRSSRLPRRVGVIDQPCRDRFDFHRYEDRADGQHRPYRERGRGRHLSGTREGRSVSIDGAYDTWRTS